MDDKKKLYLVHVMNDFWY